MIEGLMNIEFRILDFLYSLHNPVLDNIMTFITHLGDKGLLWISCAIVMCFFKKYKRAGITLLLALLLNYIIGNITLKPLIARIRPFEYAQNIVLLIPKPLDYSFPSGHSFSSFAAAFSIFLFHKKEGIAALVLAFLIAFSRLYLYVHFPSDVLAGIAFGIAVSCISKTMLSKNTLFTF